jgi:hypothetical protein
MRLAEQRYTREIEVRLTDAELIAIAAVYVWNKYVGPRVGLTA